MATLSQELTGPHDAVGSAPAQVLRSNHLTLLSERLGRGSAEILGSEVIDPEVPFLIGKDTNDMRELLKALETGSDALGIAAIRDAEARAKLAQLKQQFAGFEQNVGPILRELQKLVSARQAGASLVAASEQLQAAVGRLQEALQAERPIVAFIGVIVFASLLVIVLLVTGLVFLADTRRAAASAENENKRNQEAILRLLNEMGRFAAGAGQGPIEEALQQLGLERDIVTVVGGFATAIALARASDLIATVPERHTGILRAGMHSFSLPVFTPEFTVSLLWHPRLDADLAHRWLRGHVRKICAATT